MYKVKSDTKYDTILPYATGSTCRPINKGTSLNIIIKINGWFAKNFSGGRGKDRT